MLDNLAGFFIQWGITSLSLWVASLLFNGIRFSSTGSLIISALLLGFANAVLRPLLVILTLPLTLVTLGFFLLVINALMLLLVAKVVKGFSISGFWTAFFASLFISILSMALGSLVPNAEMTVYRLPTQAPQTISM
ncbi:MAG: phage holin family protein [Betaproteobacteria bacterium]|jgi:putative membrane protein|nr:phage holin family protein [Betaproteobacteria bacterium]